MFYRYWYDRRVTAAVKFQDDGHFLVGITVCNPGDKQNRKQARLYAEEALAARPIKVAAAGLKEELGGLFGGVCAALQEEKEVLRGNNIPSQGALSILCSKYGLPLWLGAKLLRHEGPYKKQILGVGLNEAATKLMAAGNHKVLEVGEGKVMITVPAEVWEYFTRSTKTSARAYRKYRNFARGSTTSGRCRC
jgi:hypothetical protein